jgi:hypothetical protein
MVRKPSGWPAAVAPILLLVTAAVQILLAQVADLSPWKGGGFGMFASLDHAPFRGIDIVVEAPDRSETLDVSASLEEAAARAATFPSHFRLTQLAEAVVARERRRGQPVETVKLDVWRHEFDPHSLRATERRLRSFSYRIP